METGRISRLKITGFHWLFLIFTSRTFKELCFKLEREKDLDPNVLSYLTGRFLSFLVFAIPLVCFATFVGLRTYFESASIFFLGATVFLLLLFLFIARGHIKELESCTFTYTFPVLTQGKVTGRWLDRHRGLRVDCSYLVDNKEYTGIFSVGFKNGFRHWKKGSNFPLIYSSLRPSAACPYDERMCEYLCLNRYKIKPVTESSDLEGMSGIFGAIKWVKTS